MAGPLTNADELAEFWRPLTPAEGIVADALILVASGMIRRRIPDIDARLSDGRVDQATVTYVITEMVKSAVEATNRAVDAKSETETAGPYSHSITYAASTRLAATDDLIGLLGGEVSVGIGSARLGLPERYDHECGPRQLIDRWRG